MAIKVPGNPFGVDVQVGSTQEMGLQSAKESEFSARKQFEGVNATFGKVLEDYQKDIDDTVTRENMLQLNDAMMDVLYNENTGALQQKGKNALDLVNGKSLEERTREELRKRYQEIAKGTHNKRQRDAFEKFYSNVDTSVQNKIATHVIKQQAVREADLVRKETDSLTRMATSRDPEISRSGVIGLIALSKRVAEKNGVEPDYSAVGDVILINASQAVNDGDLKLAEQIEKEYGEYFMAEQSLKYKKIYEIGKEARDVDDAASKIVENAKSRAEAFEEVEKIEGKSREKVRARVRQMFADADTARRDNAKTLEIIAYKLIKEGKSLPASDLLTLQELNPAAAKRVQKYQEDMQSGKKVDTKKDVYQKLLLLQDTKPEEFAKLDLDLYAPDINADLLNKLKNAQMKAPAKARRLFVNDVIKQAKDEGYSVEERRDIEIAACTLYDEMTADIEGGVPSKEDKSQWQNLLLNKQNIEGSVFDEYGYKVINERSGIFPAKGMVANKPDEQLRLKMTKRGLNRLVDKPFTPEDKRIAKHYALTGTWSTEARELAIKNQRIAKNDPNYVPSAEEIDKVCRFAYTNGRFEGIRKAKSLK